MVVCGLANRTKLPPINQKPKPKLPDRVSSNSIFQFEMQPRASELKKKCSTKLNFF